MQQNSQQNYYTNPAFCQQSEFYSTQRCTSPPRPSRNQNSTRQSPIGAQTPMRINEDFPPKPGPKPKQYRGDYAEQEFYEEMLVDDAGFIKQKKVVVVSSPQNDKRNGNNIYTTGTKESIRNRYEYIPMQEHDRSHRYEYITTPPSSPKNKQQQEVVEVANGRFHRYAVIPYDKEPPDPPGRYALVPLEHLNNNKGRYAVISQQSERKMTSPQPARRGGNPIATQKLHELLSTPKKTPHSPRRVGIPATPDPFGSPIKAPYGTTRGHTPKAQQKLNYALSTRQYHDKRNTAVVAPVCSSPVQSVYSETTFSNKTESWMNLSIDKTPIQATLAVAAFMMILCGGVTSGLCFYMVSIMGRQYYLDFGTMSGFSCLLLGLLGFRSRNCYWLPNRNYISGYIVLSVFSLVTCAALLVLLFMQPKPGSPLADMTSGAVCGISVLSLVLASSGVVASYCCKYPPPDNRVQHCARGFTV